MVYVAVFVPSPESLYLVTQQARRFQSSQIHVDVLHRFGTQPLDDLDKYDMIVARGITYRQICARYPQKHIIHLDFDGADIVEALLRCREQFSPRHIALCLERRGLEDLLPDLEALCEAEIRLYDVVDGESAVEAVDAALADGMDALVCAGTVGHICTDRGHPCVYIRTRREVLEGALEKAVDAARNIHIKYAISNVTRMILDDIEDAVLAVDESGRLLAANRRARQLYQLPRRGRVPVQSVSEIHPKLTYIGNPENPLRDGDEHLLTLQGQRYLVRYRLITGSSGTTGTLIVTASASKPLQDRRQLRGSLVRQGLTSKYTFDDIIAVSQAMQGKIQIAKKFCTANSSVLITGETGTGKELFAHSIHAASRRAGQPFVAVNCAALPETLLESELFGYESGAFSGASSDGKPGLFELAHHGTIFLDEIGEISCPLQAKLLRVLQEREIRRIGGTAVIPVDVRVIAATNIDIKRRIDQGNFRNDLLYRLNTFEVQIPPLREHPEDILPLAQRFLRQLSEEMGQEGPKLTSEAVALLQKYDWPGNVRELRNVCERLVVLVEDQFITAESLRNLGLVAGSAAKQPDAPPPALPARKKKKDLAKELGVSRTTLWRMSKRQQNDS